MISRDSCLFKHLRNRFYCHVIELHVIYFICLLLTVNIFVGALVSSHNRISAMFNNFRVGTTSGGNLLHFSKLEVDSMSVYFEVSMWLS